MCMTTQHYRETRHTYCRERYVQESKGSWSDARTVYTGVPPGTFSVTLKYTTDDSSGASLLSSTLRVSGQNVVNGPLLYVAVLLSVNDTLSTYTCGVAS